MHALPLRNTSRFRALGIASGEHREEVGLLEVVLVTFFVTLAVMAVGSRSRTAPVDTPGGTITLGDDIDTDLPCPWCLAQTSEEDEACPTCGQLFG